MKIRKKHNITIAITFLVLGIIFMGVDRIFVSAASTDIMDSMSYITVISLGLLLIGAVWLFKSTLDS